MSFGDAVPKAVLLVSPDHLPPSCPCVVRLRMTCAWQKWKIDEVGIRVLHRELNWRGRGNEKM
jgi:hypothetical protein